MIRTVVRTLVPVLLSVAGSNAWARVPPRVTITALCGGGTPESFAVGAQARDIDGAVFRIEPGSTGPGRKVARNIQFVGRLRDTLQKAGFDSIRLDPGAGSWCGITRTIESSSHTVRWATRSQPNGSLAHDFAGMPVEVWHVFLDLQRAATDQEVCGKFHEDLLPPSALDRAIWIACQGPGIVPQASGVYVLADGDVLTWNGSPVALGRCSRIAGEDVESRVRWHAMLNEARFEQLSDQPAHAQYGSVNCSIGRSLQAKPHVVGLTGVSVGQSREPAKDPRWKAVQRVFAELSELSARLRNERRPELAPRHAMNP